MDEQDNTSGISKRTLIVLGVIIAILALLFTIDALSKSSNDSKSYTLSVSDGEAVAISDTRLAIANSALDGSGKIDQKTCDKLETVAKKLDVKASWFSGCYKVKQGATADTSNNQILKLSDGDYCATFTLDKEGKNLTAYKLNEGECGDARITVE